MAHAYWNDWYFGWAGFFGSDCVPTVSSLGNWGYTYRLTKIRQAPRRTHSTFSTRVREGRVNRDEYNQMKSEIAKE